MVRSIALLLTVLTGFSGLVYQVAWQRYLAILLGSHAEATAAVLGIFLGGLSVGYALFGRVSRMLVQRAEDRGRSARLLFAYGIVEVGIGVYALAFPTLFAGIRGFSLWLPHGSEALAFGIDVGLTVLLIGPPTVLMGGTIPLLTQGLARGLSDATRFHSFVYSFNTAGAFAGALAAGFWLVPVLGLRGSVAAMGGVNLFAGLVFTALGWHGSRRDATAASDVGAAATPTRFAVYATAAGLAGFAMMTFQTALNRIGALSLGASHFTFAMVVATFVLGIALGSLAVSALPRIRRSYLIVSQWLLVLLLLAAYPAFQYAPYWTYILRRQFPPEAFYGFHLQLFLWSLGLLVIPLGLSGATLPLLFHHLRREVGDLGAVAGRLYAWNTFGSLVGALLGGYLLLFWFDLHQTYRFAVAALGIGAALLSAQVYASGRYWGGGLLVATLLALLAVPAWQPERMAQGLFRQPLSPRPWADLPPDAFLAQNWMGKRIVFYDDDPSISVSAVAYLDGLRQGVAIYNNGKPDSGIPVDRMTSGMLGLLPALFAEQPERAFVVGYGSGYTAGALAALDSVREVVVSEISQGVIDAAPTFEPYNLHASQSPKTRIVRSDAYRALLRSPERFDVIVSSPSNPWVAGVEVLYSREFLQAARSRLTSGGVWAQFFHLYEMDSATVAMVLRTYMEAFDRVAVWVSSLQSVIILGFNDDGRTFALEQLAERFRRPDFQAGFQRIGISSFAALLAFEAIPVDVLPKVPLEAEIHTTLHPILSDRAARAFFRGGEASLPATNRSEAARVGARNSLAGQVLAGLDGEARTDALADMVRMSCENRDPRCLTLIAHWRHEDPGSPRLAHVLRRLRRDEAVSATLSEGNLAYVGQLFEAGGIADVPPTYDTARIVLGLFTNFYHHALPFEPRALRAAWERCSRDDPRCASGLRAVRGLGLLAAN